MYLIHSNLSMLKQKHHRNISNNVSASESDFSSEHLVKTNEVIIEEDGMRTAKQGHVLPLSFRMSLECQELLESRECVDNEKTVIELAPKEREEMVI